MKGKKEMKALPKKGQNRNEGRQTWSWRGIIKLYESLSHRDGSRIRWPYNYFPKEKWHNVKLMEMDVFEREIRVFGWLKKGLTIPIINACVKYGMSENGTGSPYTWFNPTEAFQRFNSPQKFARVMYAVLKRANEILRPFGERVMLKHVYRGVIYKRTISKSAFFAVQETLSEKTKFYRDKRNLAFYRGYSEYKKLDELEKNYVMYLVKKGGMPNVKEAIRLLRQNTEILYEEEKVLVVKSEEIFYKGFRIYPCFITDYKRYPVTLIRSPKRSTIVRCYFDDITRKFVRDVLKEGIKEFREKEKKLKMLDLKVLLPENMDHLVHLNDALDIGLCFKGVK